MKFFKNPKNRKNSRFLKIKENWKSMKLLDFGVQMRISLIFRKIPRLQTSLALRNFRVWENLNMLGPSTLRELTAILDLVRYIPCILASCEFFVRWGMWLYEARSRLLLGVRRRATAKIKAPERELSIAHAFGSVKRELRGVIRGKCSIPPSCPILTSV